MKRALLVAVAGLVVVACGQEPATRTDLGNYRLFLRDYSSISVADATSGRILSSLPAGVQTPDWSRLYAVSGSNLLALDRISGQTLAEVRLPGPYQIPFPSTPLAAVSPNGRWVALSRWDSRDSAPGIGASHFAVVDGERKSLSQQVDLKGYWTVDAVSNDGRWLYLIENLAAGYRVRLYDLAAGALNPTVVADPHDLDAPMTGDRMDSVASPDGTWIYSLYATAGGAFIHALPVGSGSTSAACIDLPGISSRYAMTLTINGDGTRLYITDGLAETVREVMPPGAGGTGKVARSLHVPPQGTAFNPFLIDAEASGPGDGLGSGMHSVLTSSGLLYFPLGAGIAAVDVKTWRARGRYLGSQQLRTLALSSDGRWMYGVTQTQHLIRIDPGRGQLVQDLRNGPWSLQLERVEV
jgi:hypothetical protein